MKKKENNRIPILIGVINGLVPGLGYIVCKKRKIFSYFLLAGTLLSITDWFIFQNLYSENFESPIFMVAILLMTIAFAYDGYKEASN